jgi:hypothetical protein
LEILDFQNSSPASQPERDRERRKAKEEDPCGERKKEKAGDE